MSFKRLRENIDGAATGLGVVVDRANQLSDISRQTADLNQQQLEVFRRAKGAGLLEPGQAEIPGGVIRTGVPVGGGVTASLGSGGGAGGGGLVVIGAGGATLGGVLAVIGRGLARIEDAVSDNALVGGSARRNDI